MSLRDDLITSFRVGENPGIGFPVVIEQRGCCIYWWFCCICAPRAFIDSVDDALPLYYSGHVGA